MKQLIILFSLFCFILPAVGQGLAFDIVDLREVNDSLLFRYNAVVTPSAIRTGQSLRVTPLLRAGIQYSFFPVLPFWAITAGVSGAYEPSSL